VTQIIVIFTVEKRMIMKTNRVSQGAFTVEKRMILKTNRVSQGASTVEK